MTEEIKNTTRIPTETMEEPEQQARKASTVPDEPTHKEILKGVYDSSDYINLYMSQLDSRIGKIENSNAELTKKLYEIKGDFSTIKTIGLVILIPVVIQLITTFFSIFPRLSSIETNISNINNAITKIDKKQDALDNKQQELKENQKNMAHHQERINDRNTNILRQLHSNSYNAYR